MSGMSKAKKIWLSALVMAHTLLLIFATYLWLNLPFTYDNESAIISWSSIIKNVVLGLEAKPAKEDFLLINTAYEKAFIPKLDEFGFELGRETITDRQSLAVFFQKASSKNQHQFIVCDVFLESPSEHDSLLLASVRATKNIRFPYHREGGEFLSPIIPVPVAFSDYDTDFGNFLKYSYLQFDTCRSMALEMYTKIDKAEYNKRGIFYTKNGDLALNSFIIEFPIRQFDIFRDDTLGYNSMHLSNFLSLPDELAYETLKDKIVVVGDFLEADMHQTIYGTTAGPLIHLDAYLNLKQNRNNLPVWFFLYLFIFYALFSYTLLFSTSLFTIGWVKKIQVSKWGGFIVDYLKYAFFLLLMSVVSFLIFDVHLNVLVLSLYFSLAEYGIEFVNKRLDRKTETV
jgi:CHASE2 domain